MEQKMAMPSRLGYILIMYQINALL